MQNQELEKLLHNARFFTSATKLSQLPPDQGKEVAFVGRSNVGKSSALNMICGQQRLAYSSKTPGRTQLINLFTVNEQCRLVDLPGYGYAQAPPEVKQSWEQMLENYLQQRTCLQGLILFMDCRHPLKPLDQQLLDWAAHCQLPVHAVLTKADKLSRGNTLTLLQKIKCQIADTTSIQLFSSLNKTGKEDLLTVLTRWFGDE